MFEPAGIALDAFGLARGVLAGAAVAALGLATGALMAMLRRSRVQATKAREEATWR
jgi:hypothetical protein